MPRVTDFRWGVLKPDDPTQAPANTRALRDAFAAGGQVLLPAGRIYTTESLIAPPAPLRAEGAGLALTALQNLGGGPTFVAGLAPGKFGPADFPDASAVLGAPRHGVRLGKGRWIFAPFAAPTVLPFHELDSWWIEVAGDFGAGLKGWNVLVGGGQQALLAAEDDALLLQIAHESGRFVSARLPVGPIAGVRSFAAGFSRSTGQVTWAVDGRASGPVPMPGFAPGDRLARNDTASWKVGAWSPTDSTQDTGMTTDPGSAWTLLGFRVSSGARPTPAAIAALRRPDPQTIACLTFAEDPAAAASSRLLALRNGPASGYDSDGFAVYADPSVGVNNTSGFALKGLTVSGNGSPFGVALAAGLFYGADFEDLAVERAAVGFGGLSLGATYVLHFRGRTRLSGSYCALHAYLGDLVAEGLVEVLQIGRFGLYLDQSEFKFNRLGFFVNPGPTTRHFVYARGHFIGDVLYADNEDPHGTLESLFRFDLAPDRKSTVVDLRAIDYSTTPATCSVVCLGNALGVDTPGRVTIGSITAQGPTNARAVVEVRDARWQGEASLAWEPPPATPKLLDATGSAAGLGVVVIDAAGKAVTATSPVAIAG